MYRFTDKAITARLHRRQSHRIYRFTDKAIIQNVRLLSFTGASHTGITDLQIKPLLLGFTGASHTGFTELQIEPSFKTCDC